MTRALTLLEICTQAIEDVDGVEVPSTIFGNSDLTAVGLKRAAIKAGRELTAELRWQALETEYNFATVSGVSSYTLPTDYQAFANGTCWDRSEDRPMTGPATPRIWQNLQSSLVAVGLNTWFRVAGNYFQLFAAPTSVRTISYRYYSRFYASTTGGTAIQDFAADSDICRLDGELMVLGVTYYFKRRKGLPYTDDKADYIAAMRAYQADDTPKPRIDVSGEMPHASNLPDTGFGGVSSGGGGTPPTFDDDDGIPTFDSDS